MGWKGIIGGHFRNTEERGIKEKLPEGKKKQKHTLPEKRKGCKPDMRQLRVPNNGGAPFTFWRESDLSL